ncbi:ATP-dependent dethiobiotin synthetase BioD [Lysobacter xinjiangensis]|uniref:ATP-dependent dethiobiotin synthetase BioD n=1 Tax=Cognatilysobacter xinjiangensis TaxID=546892 RepID=A0ABQ3C5U1_9GAMM|nr:dethiobiotin synthase [Lysobacter xinjiangensis]GGZ66545.1 ATP-dependent dethiobiotin synthetase BioD [Lysobacter xinjiangensis]
MHGFFVTGTDTGVGKTRIATAFAHALGLRGLRVQVRKPVESGVDARTGPADAQALREAAGAHEAIDTVCALTLRAALSPERAAALEGVELPLSRLVEAARRDVADDGLLLVEGAGGFYSPIATGALNADLAAALGLPVIVVAADRLGALNHVLLTVEAVQRRGLEVAAIVLSRPAPVVDDGMDNAADLRARLPLPVIALPHGASSTNAWRDEAASLAPLVDALASKGLLP